MTVFTTRRSIGLSIIVAVLAAVVVYAPAVRSGFVSDDYSFAWAARRTGIAEWGKMLTGVGRLPEGNVAFSYWRPATLGLFIAMRAVFGDDPTGYHVIVLTGHLAATTLIILIAARLTMSRWIPLFTGLFFTLQPLTFAATTWISSLNSLALPIMLGAWLIVIRTRLARWWHVAVVAALVTLSLLFRETASGILFAVVGVHLATRPRTESFGWSARRFAPILAVAAVLTTFGLRHYSKYTDAPRQPASQTFAYYWNHLRRALIPIEAASGSWVSTMQVAGGICVLLALLLLVALRWWVPAVLLGSAHISLLMYGSVVWGDSGRYFYFPSALIALWLAATLDTIAGHCSRRLLLPARIVLTVTMVLWCLASAWALRDHIDAWIRSGPDEHDELVELLRARSSPPEESVIDVANLPPSLTYFDGYNLPFISDFVWPGRDVTLQQVPVELIERLNGTFGPNTVLVYDPDTGTCRDVRESGVEPWPAAALQVDMPGEGAPASEVELFRFGPYEDTLHASLSWEHDGAGHARVRLEVPWFPVEYTAWAPVHEDGTEVTVLTNLLEGVYEILVDQVVVWRLDTSVAADTGRTPIMVETGPFDESERLPVTPIELSPCRPEGT